ncbi:triphosphoribosyl-dephospho-CoA synthase MdcB [Undibacterium sp. TC4M20W]|uniref:triphosphoribosyl-dephospho-CoA synthase MdcB n=1 Tax=Undibacterium sp. TC4M20W TaxID=3413052 RepID=UPI003BF233E3
MLEIARAYRYLPTASVANCESKKKCVAQQIARIAVRSLYAELVLYPKPGLVSLRDNGSHTDMDAACFMRSLFSLRHYFRDIAFAGAIGAEFEVLRQLGMAAEQRMLKATRGINTHRGAIFALGMLSAAAGYCLSRDGVMTAVTLRQALISQWGQALSVHSAPEDTQHLSHGLQAAKRYAASGAREEAALGFPSIFELALPRLQQSLKDDRSLHLAQVDCFFTLMAHISDTNLYHRGGIAGIAYAKDTAQKFLDHGGTANPQWLIIAENCHREFIARRLSPGGAADMLAATCFVHYCMEEFSVTRIHE